MAPADGLAKPRSTSSARSSGARSGGLGVPARPRRPTTTARFGSSRRESHDASGFYGRFVPPEISHDETLAAPGQIDVIYEADARAMTQVASNSVALVVTSPPYFAGKEYEQSLGHDGVPGSYFEYLGLLGDVFAECKRALEPGGRIAVNVANLGRRPYRSLAGDVTQVLQDLGLLMRGEVVWWKGRAAGGSCAWGTFQQPGNPVLRDVTERVVIASKGRFDRALPPGARRDRRLPSAATISRDEFLDATTDLWEIPPESASRVGHPAPFPVDLPARVIELYTYENDVVLDPFIGSGTTAVAALRTRRHFVGYDTDPRYVRLARERVRLEKGGSEVTAGRTAATIRASAKSRPGRDETFASLAMRQGLRAREIAELVLSECGFTAIRAGVKVPAVGLEMDFDARDAAGDRWVFEVCGSYASNRAGLRRSEILWRALGKAAVVSAAAPEVRLVLLTTDLPAPGSAQDRALCAVSGTGRPVLDVVELLDPSGHDRLRAYASLAQP
jgi:DNA modification methylase